MFLIPEQKMPLPGGLQAKSYTSLSLLSISIWLHSEPETALTAWITPSHTETRSDASPLYVNETVIDRLAPRSYCPNRKTAKYTGQYQDILLCLPAIHLTKTILR